MQISSFETDLLNKHKYIISLDEAGRGPWAGPVTVGGVLVNAGLLESLTQIEFLNDSKKLSSKKRQILEEQIENTLSIRHIADVSHEIIDKINILEATKLGVLECLDHIAEAFLKLAIEQGTGQIQSIGILIDGKFSYLEQKTRELSTFISLPFELITVIDGDAICPSIAAASILAKEHRDRLMNKLHLTYPEYGFDKHKGYGTKLHSDRLKLFGPCEIHRKSFRPVKELMTNHRLELGTPPQAVVTNG